MSESELYSDTQRAFQDQFDARQLADAVAQIVAAEIGAEEQGFIESRDFFFLSTVDASGHPTVSHKGGKPGFVVVADPRTIVFPSYDGNGMFLSMGNIADNAKIGLLFMDFETPHRLRLRASATVSVDDPLADRFPGADLIVRATVEQVFINCGRYIHRHTRNEPSRYVPDATGAAPLPAWKRIDIFQSVLPARDQGRAETEGGLLTFDEYAAKVAAGEP